VTTLDIRPLEPGDVRAAHDIVSHPEVARVLGGTPLDPPHAYEQRFLASFEHPGVERLGAFKSRKLVAFAEIARGSRGRNAHAARLALAVRPSEQRRGIGTTLLAAVLDAADRWMNLVRLELEIPAADGATQAFLERHGFAVEVRRRVAMVIDGGLADTLTLARLRPGFVQPEEALQPMPPAPPRRGPPDGVVVRAATLEDAPGLARFSRDPSMLWGSSQVPTMGDDYWRRRMAGNPAGVWTAVVEVDGEVVACGGVYAQDLPRSRHAVSLGMSVMRPFQGRGLGERLMLALLETAERWLGAERIELIVFTDNTRAVRLYEKHGFEPEGVLRLDVWRDGGYASSQVMARLRPRAAA
jgi:putative acetyltransferase